MLDTKYTDRMKKLLGADFEKYIATFDDERETALHLNAAKLSDTNGASLPFENE